MKAFKVALLGQQVLIGLVEYPNSQFIGYFNSHRLQERLNGLKGFGVTVYEDGFTEYSGENDFDKELAQEAWNQMKDKLDTPLFIKECVRNL